MKTRNALCGLTLGLLLSVPCLTQAQNLSIDWHRVAGGGGASSGGNLILTGTIGQPAAGTSSSGNLVLEGGFWPGPFALPQAGSPLLSIQHSGPNIIFSWPAATPGFRLQERLNLSAGQWTDSPSGAKNPITLPAVNASQFYRLTKP